MENKVTFYEIANSIKVIEEMEDEGMNEYLDTLNMQMSEKVENIIRYRQSLTMSADAIGNEIERLSKLKTSLSNRAKSLEGYIAYTMGKNELEKIETSIAKVSFRKSESVEVDNIELIPAEFIITKTTKQADKIAIKNAIKGGKEIPGATIKQNKSLQIK